MLFGFQASLILLLLQYRKPCSPTCPCDQPGDWRSQIISLAALEEVEIEGFEGAAYEVDLVKHLIRCAPMLKVITIRLLEKASPYGRGCKKIYCMFKACPSLKWSFYHSSGKLVSYEWSTLFMFQESCVVKQGPIETWNYVLLLLWYSWYCSGM